MLKSLILLILISNNLFAQKGKHWIDKLNLYDVKCRMNWEYSPDPNWLILHKDGTFELSMSVSEWARDDEFVILYGNFRKSGNALIMTMDEPYYHEFSNGRKEKLLKEFTIIFNTLNNRSLCITKGFWAYGKSPYDGNWKWMDEKPHYYFRDRL